MPDGFEADSKAQIPTNLRLLLILEEVVKAGTPVAPSALSDTLGLPKPTIHRLLTTAATRGATLAAFLGMILASCVLVARLVPRRSVADMLDTAADAVKPEVR